MTRPMKPIIGLNCDVLDGEKTELRLYAAYVDAVSAAGAVPLVLPPVGGDADVAVLLNRVAGLVLIGKTLVTKVES